MDILPGLPRTQRNEVIVRGFQRFRDMPVEDRDVTFDGIIVGNLHVLTFRYTRGFTPRNPRGRDISAMLGGGYHQSHIRVSVVRITSKISPDELEVELEQPVVMSHRNGPTVESDRYALHRDGYVKYFPGLGNESKDWSSYIPLWEHTKYPILPVITHGV